MSLKSVRGKCKKKERNMDRQEICGMDALTAILTRRSIRRYTGDPVTQGEINTLLTAGFYAPSASDRRPWEFVVVRDRTILNRFAENGQYQKMMYEARAAIIVCGNEKRMPVHDLLINDCSAASQNILLAAHAIGLGAVWCGIVQPEMIKRFREDLGLPEHILPVAAIALGHPAERRTAQERYNAANVHEEKYRAGSA
jgi:nitroreductase